MISSAAEMFHAQIPSGTAVPEDYSNIAGLSDVESHQVRELRYTYGVGTQGMSRFSDEGTRKGVDELQSVLTADLTASLPIIVQKDSEKLQRTFTQLPYESNDGSQEPISLVSYAARREAVVSSDSSVDL